MTTNDTRIKNLNTLITEHGSQKNLSIAADIASTQISGLVNGVRSMGEKTARKIETKLKLPNLWMDQNHFQREPILDEALSKLRMVHPDALPTILGAIEASPKRK